MTYCVTTKCALNSLLKASLLSYEAIPSLNKIPYFQPTTAFMRTANLLVPLIWD